MPNPKRQRILLLSIVLLFVGVAGGATAVLIDRGTPLQVLAEVGAFELAEIGGGTVGSRALEGRIWVADFIFTRCGSVCPEMTRSMATLHQRLADKPEVRFVSVSVDPKYDTPEALAEYARAHEADRSRWFFLYGGKEEVAELSHARFKLGDKDDPLNHSPRFALVDDKGRIRGYYTGAGDDSEAEIERLERDIRRLLRYGSSW